VACQLVKGALDAAPPPLRKARPRQQGWPQGRSGRGQGASRQEARRKAEGAGFLSASGSGSAAGGGAESGASGVGTCAVCMDVGPSRSTVPAMSHRERSGRGLQGQGG
jgi:hypothetical protein